MIGWHSEPQLGEEPLWLQGVAVLFLAGIALLGLWLTESVAIGTVALGFVSGALLTVFDKHVEVTVLDWLWPEDRGTYWVVFIIVIVVFNSLDVYDRIGAALGAGELQRSSFLFGFVAGMSILFAVYLVHTWRTQQPAPA